MAQVYVILGRLNKGLECSRTAISMDPWYPEYHAESGNILQQQDRVSEAIDHYAKALKCSPPYPEVHLGRPSVMPNSKNGPMH